MQTMHQPYSAQEYIQGVAQVMVQSLDWGIAGIFAMEQAHHVIERSSDNGKIICRINAPDNFGYFEPYLIRIAVGEQAIDFSECRSILHGQALIPD
ncbi:MAG: hypothetical protein Q7T21_09330 [Gallionella sp.]|nr:hypothetical protein [Gallionella sp.]